MSLSIESERGAGSVVAHLGQIVAAVSNGGGGGRVAVRERRHRGRCDALDVTAGVPEILMVMMIVIPVVIVKTVESWWPCVHVRRGWRPVAHWMVIFTGRRRRRRWRRRGWIVGGGCRRSVVDGRPARWRYLERMQRGRWTARVGRCERCRYVAVLRRLREERRRPQMTEIAPAIPIDSVIRFQIQPRSCRIIFLKNNQLLLQL